MHRISSLVSLQLAGLIIALAAASPVAAGLFTVASGTNTSLATAQPINVSPNLVLHQQAPNYTLATAQPVSSRGYDVFGSIHAGIRQEFFTFPLSPGNQLAAFVQADNPAMQFPQLLLYHNNDNLVAIANGNASDGSSSLIDFQVPADLHVDGAAGTRTQNQQIMSLLL